MTLRIIEIFTYCLNLINRKVVPEMNHVVINFLKVINPDVVHTKYVIINYNMYIYIWLQFHWNAKKHNMIFGLQLKYTKMWFAEFTDGQGIIGVTTS